MGDFTVITSAGVVIEILGVIALVIALFFRGERGPGVVLTTAGFDPHLGAYLPAWISLPLTAAIIASLAFHLRRDALLLAPQAVTEFLLKEGDRCELTLRKGAILHGRVRGSTFVSPALIVVDVQVDDRRWPRAVVLLPDSASGNTRRQLRVWLRYRLGHETKESEPL